MSGQSVNTGSLELRTTGDFREHVYHHTVNVVTGETWKSWSNLHADIEPNAFIDEHNRRVASRLQLNREIQAYKNMNLTFRTTDELFLHRIKYRSLFMICYIPIPIPCLCHVGDYVDVLMNDAGEVFPAFIPSDVLRMNITEFCTKCCCPTPYCHVQIEEFLKCNGYVATKDDVPCECNHKVKFPVYRNACGMQEACVFSVRCLEVIKFTRVKSNMA